MEPIMTIIDLDEWLTIKQSCKRLGISRQHLYRIASRLDWEYETVGHTVLYPRAMIDAYKPTPLGRPKTAP